MVALQPDNLYFRFQQAVLYNLWEEYRKEIDLLLPLYRVDSLRLYTLKQLAAGYSELKMSDSALYYYNKALWTDSADRTGDTDLGLEYYNRTLRLILPSPQFLSTVYSEMSGLFNQLGQTDTALFFLQKALQTNPENVLLVFKIAYQYDYYMRRPEDALPWYRDFALKNPDPGSRLFSQPYQISYQEFTARRIEEIEKRETKSRRP